jgi:hypothetical protein
MADPLRSLSRISPVLSCSLVKNRTGMLLLARRSPSLSRLWRRTTTATGEDGATGANRRDCSAPLVADVRPRSASKATKGDPTLSFAAIPATASASRRQNGDRRRERRDRLVAFRL